MYNYTYIPCLALRSVADVTRTLRIPVIYSSSINDKNYSNPQVCYYTCLLLIATRITKRILKRRLLHATVSTIVFTNF